MSDIHLEYYDLHNLPGGDILFLLGDIWEIIQMRPNATDPQSRGLRKKYIRFIEEELSKYEEVYILKGNHEYFNLFWEDANRILLNFLEKYDKKKHIKLLDNSSVLIEDVLFIGSTLWATYGYGTINEIAIQNRMPDLTFIKTRDYYNNDNFESQMYGRKIKPIELFNAHLYSINYIRQELMHNQNRPCVVLTHHAPSYLARTESSNLDETFVSNQHEIIDNYLPAMWVYGHLHENRRFYIGKTLLVSNCRGYYGYESCARIFSPSAANFKLEDIKEKNNG